MSSTKHIVFVTPGFAKSESDSVCTPYLQDYFRALKSARPDWRISIVAMQYPYQKGSYTWEGITVQAIGGKNRRLSKPWVWKRTAKAIQSLHNVQPIDVMHSFWLTEATQVASKVASKLGIQHFASAMGQDVGTKNRQLKRLPFDKMKVIAISEFNAELVKKAIGREADAMIPFAVAEADIDRTNNADRPIDVLVVGSLIPVKRYERILRIVKMVSELHPNIHVEVIGSGPERAKMERLAAALGIQDKVQFLGELPRAAVLAKMSQAKVFLHASAMEGTGLVLLEALGRGAHVVTSAVGVGASLPASVAADKSAVSDATFVLYEATLNFLKHPVDAQPRVPFPMAKMVADHLQCYGIDA
ncbi:MAG: glycosyltransferase [Bacteroidetes bacterium]|nr:glycosyltransferase [Bacteroidota bacterium]